MSDPSMDPGVNPPNGDAFIRVRCVARSQTGPVRTENQDRWLIQREVGGEASALVERTLGGEPLLVAIADGMGGHVGGAEAAELALRALTQHFFASDAPRPDAERLRDVIRETQLTLREQLVAAGLYDAGTTLAGIAAPGEDPRALWVFHIGDSRVLRVRAGEVEPLTIDHTPIGDLMRYDGMSEHEAKRRIYRSGLTQCLGGWRPCEPTLAAVQWQPGDLFVLCTDGLHGVEGGLPRRSFSSLKPQRSLPRQADSLVKRALLRDGADNATVLLLSFEDEASARSP